MRPQQKQNRPRNKPNRKPNGYAVNRVYESNGPEGKVRGTPQQIIEKYQSLARDKSTAGDRILSESFLQHAEHYMRILTAAQASAAQKREEAREDEGDDVEAEGGRAERHEGRGDGGRRDRGERGGRRGPADESDRTPEADPLAVMDGDGEAGTLVSDAENAREEPRRAPRRTRTPRRREPKVEAEATEANDGGEPSLPGIETSAEAATS